MVLFSLSNQDYGRETLDLIIKVRVRVTIMVRGQGVYRLRAL